MNFLDNYGLYNQSGLTPLYTPEEQLEMEQRRRRRPDDDGLLPTYPTDFSVPDLDTLLASVDPTAAPTGINPAAPPESQPPAVANPITSGPEPNKYQRMEGVTLNDRLQSLAMTMSAVGTPQFADVYAKANHLLALKQERADQYNRSLDEAINPKTEIRGNYLVTYEPQYIRNADGTYSINPKAGNIRNKERAGTNGSNGQAYNTFLSMRENGDIDKDMTWDEFQQSSAFDPFRTDYSRKVRDTRRYLQSIGMDDPDLASQMAAGSLSIEDMEGGGIKVFDAAGNVVKEIESAEEARGFKEAFERASAFGAKSGESAVTDLQGFEDRFRELGNGADAIISGIENARNVMKLYEGEDGEPIDSNVVRGMMARFFGIGDQQMGMLMGMETEALLEALQTTTLVPVSDADIRALRSMFASVTDNPELAMGKLRSFMMAKERQLRFDRDQFRRELDRLGENRNINNPLREVESFKNTYRYLYDFETQEEFLNRTGGKK